MRVLREPQIISGFIYEQPVDAIPALTHCGEALCCRGHALPIHTHEGFEFLYLSRGTCHWEINGHTYRQTMGDMVITYPNEAHSTGSKSNPENQHVWLGLRLGELGPEGIHLAHEIQMRGVRLLSECEDAELILHAIISQVVELRSHREKVIFTLVHAFIALMTQRVTLDSSSQEMPKVRSMLPYSLAVQSAITYMRRNLDRRIQLSELTMAATFRNVSYFCTQFHHEVGSSPARYHMNLRLEAARDMLRQPDVDITTTALQFGFSSAQHFSSLFRVAFGVTPRQWKEKMKPVGRRLNPETMRSANFDHSTDSPAKLLRLK